MKKYLLFNTIMAAAVLSVTSIAAAASGYGDCKVTGEFGRYKLTPAVADTFTVQVTLPAPGDYNGDTAQDIKSGYSYCLAAEIAHRGGLPGVTVKNVSFDALITGRTKNYDVAIMQLFKTPAREAVADFSKPYLRVNTGVLVRAKNDITPETIKDAKIGILIGSIQEKFVSDVLKPKEAAAQFQSINDMVTALRARQIDVVLLDTTLSMIAAKQTDNKLKVVGQYDVGGDASILLPKGSSNTAIVNSIVADLRAEGRLDSLLEEQFAPFMGGNPNDLPLWKAQ
ncbi:ABC transporter substrate-binding protein [Ochrobactrum teleogrylli]|uniref:Amino acid ABC transporter substrate-binding protein n=1 Tax=Ochrobactrum teleogrylli TaxID=2479765 RepID=A0ABY2XYQ9_9HYPH|nr:ABC transporter substrate-binding protein [[Ochrobactrum] teleogrylli]TNV10080.1 amino acid ABC transporter substrate-binding protein [[Ochrobactrum] teleogrylli]